MTGLVIAFAGFAIMGKARDLFKKYNTSLSIEKPSFLIVEGVFSKSRNPMYAGMFLLLLGIAVCFGNIVSVCVPFVFIILIWIIFISAEEKIMENNFGERYIGYKKRTGMWI
jgi:protein-S-isoprenylcysteine O-methyltransferase Ste14